VLVPSERGRRRACCARLRVLVSLTTSTKLQLVPSQGYRWTFSSLPNFDSATKWIFRPPLSRPTLHRPIHGPLYPLLTHHRPGPQR
jgi:hypothetical protein